MPKERRTYVPGQYIAKGLFAPLTSSQKKYARDRRARLKAESDVRNTLQFMRDEGKQLLYGAKKKKFKPYDLMTYGIKVADYAIGNYASDARAMTAHGALLDSKKIEAHVQNLRKADTSAQDDFIYELGRRRGSKAAADYKAYLDKPKVDSSPHVNVGARKAAAKARRALFRW